MHIKHIKVGNSQTSAFFITKKDNCFPHKCHNNTLISKHLSSRSFVLLWNIILGFLVSFLLRNSLSGGKLIDNPFLFLFSAIMYLKEKIRKYLQRPAQFSRV